MRIVVHNYEIIRQLLTEDPRLVESVDELLKRYRIRCGQTTLTKNSLRRILNRKSPEWLGIEAPRRRTGRPIRHDEDLVASLKEMYPSATQKRIADLYNTGSTRPYLPWDTVGRILRKRK